MTAELGYIDPPAPVDPRAEAIMRLLERTDPDDEKRRHTLSQSGDPRKARRFVHRCQRAYVALSLLERSA